MTLDVHTLDQVLLVGAAVLLVSILAVRVSVGFGLPTPADLPADRRAAGGVRVRPGVRQRRGRARARLRGADPDPGRGGPDDAVAGDPAGDAVGRLAGDDRCRGERRGDGGLLPLRARADAGSSSVLLGAVTSPTDAAAVFSVLRKLPLPRRLTGALEAESGLNDAPTVVLVTLVSAGAPTTVSWGSPARSSGSSGSASPRAWSSGSAAPGCCVAPHSRARASTRWPCCR